MPSKIEYRKQVAKIIHDNRQMDFAAIHQLLHNGNYEGAAGWAETIGLNLPPNQRPISGSGPLPEFVQDFLRDIFDTHLPTETGLPDHSYEFEI